MLVLALDTTSRQGSVAITRDGTILALWQGDPRITHGERLPGDLFRALERGGAALADVDLFAVAAGPGSFTGLRIGIAAMQGLAFASGRPLVGVSALDAVAETARQSMAGQPDARALPLAVWMDAQRGEVFSSLYSGNGPIDTARVGRPGDILTEWQRTGLPPVFAGDGALAYAADIRRVCDGAWILDALPALAPAVARLAEARGGLGDRPLPDAIRPVYVRRSDAELARDRKAQSHAVEHRAKPL